ncbi:cyclic pyranopterin monophosphate synthase MoaC [Thermodesulfobacterium commune]|uniref:Cyclic pyranopterin monophosphate synthase n=1 Tax=Thermodesulfobacterium commune DSM 2178 TaxID=289377 RepID=A0A075WZR1_9BACT|nr:cyclic pyranopterin monophosphate synthase MoaC [Thermodesulfobacterium commune]AIH04172.1 molybdenum cofactor biosynthesis protein MoaC [Thermodesulfobacterium commune DSM 2178]HCE80047.1 cyclic pyranopterin monophosphate synthase MoaC [Thermodesulfobacterium commune]
MAGFTHLDSQGNLFMVDVGGKPATERIAIAKAEVVFPEEIYPKVISQDIPKGDFLACAKVAGILGAKKTSELIPLCHPLPISKVDLNFRFIPERYVLEIEGMVKTVGQTGVEMEALTAVSIAALTVYDMCKALDKRIKITNIRLVYKTGGKSGEVVLEEQPGKEDF